LNYCVRIGKRERLVTQVVHLTIPGQLQRFGSFRKVSQLIDEGIHMPAFTFEKISPPAPQGSIPPVAATAVVRKPRGVIVQMLDRIVEARARRSLREDKGVIARREPKPQD
jgi:hypothetical protein